MKMNGKNITSKQFITISSFEIKCLSKKNPVKVGDYSYDCKDKACPLESKSLITLGKFQGDKIF